MEPFPKRQRIYSPIGPAFPQSFDSEDVYYDEDDFIVDDEEVEEEDIEEPPPDLDPESDFQRKRARLDYKLKSTFEAIFEKYGKDFDGVGDEIDLATGEIVVNNGHILEMTDERDAGDIDAQSIPTESTEESREDSPDEEISDTEEEEDEGASEEASDGEQLDDDLILRGFARANRFSKPSPELGSLREPVRPPTAQPTYRRPSPPPAKISKSRLPSQAEILARFGPQLGPQIAEYVSKHSAAKPTLRPTPKPSAGDSVWRAPQIPAFKPRRQDDDNIESAWRAPEIPAFKPKRQEVRAPVDFSPEPERSPSPEEATSIWALPGKRGRKRKSSISHIAHRNRESSVNARHREEYAFDPSGLPVSETDFRHVSPSGKKRRKFTEEDDQILFSWVNFATQKGMIFNHALWKKLEEKHPNHRWSSWEYRYKHHLTYLLSNSTEDSEVSVSEPSVDSMYVAPRDKTAHRFDLPSDAFEDDTPRVRPNRIRKPAQKDSKIISWSQAVDALESIDPEIHAGMMHDAGVMETRNPHFDHSMDFGEQVYNQRNTTQISKQQAVIRAPRLPPKVVVDLTEDAPDAEEPLGPSSEDSFVPRVPCPHVDCRSHPRILYRLQLREDEELSEMSSHLFRAHRTTPYPCMELKCSRLGEQGFFMAADLVRHVRKSHPSLGALYRLRGRVNSELLEDNSQFSSPPSDSNGQLNRPVSQQRDSDFMSPRKVPAVRRPSSSQQYSSSMSDHTPRASTTIPGMARSTPMTSVSSTRVHHPSAAKTSIEEDVEEEDEHNNLHYMKYIDDMSMRAQKSSRGISERPNFNRPQALTQAALPSLKGKEKEISCSNSSLPTPITASGSFSDTSFSFFDTTTSHQRPALQQQRESVGFHSTSEVYYSTSVIPEIPDLTSPEVQRKAQPAAEVYDKTRAISKSKQATVPRNMQRNFLDPSYEFSDEEPEPNRVHNSTSTEARNVITKPQAAVTSLLPPSVIPTSHTQYTSPKKTPVTTYSRKRPRVAKPRSNTSFATPAAQKVVKQSLLRMALDAEDFDELSLGTDDVVLMSSQPRLKPLSAIPIKIKQEDVMNTPRPLSTVSRKRTFTTFRSSSPDELVVVNSSPFKRSGTVSQPTIKTEEEVSLPEHPRTTTIHHGLPQSHTTPSSIPRNMALRTSTPLLNLTPTHHPLPKPRFEVPNSTAEEEKEEEEAELSSPSLPTHPPERPRTKRQRTATKSVSTSPAPLLTELLTPTKKRMSSGDLLKAEQITVVVKTPNGTFRRCGEDGFVCGRSFCFRCGSGGGNGVRARV